MVYKYKSITNGVFNFTIPGEDRTVTLFYGDPVIVKEKLSGSYLRALSFVEEIKEEKPKTTKTTAKKQSTKQSAKVEDKITSVEEVDEKKEAENVEVKADDNKPEVDEQEEKPKTTKKTTRRRRKTTTDSKTKK